MPRVLQITLRDMNGYVSSNSEGLGHRPGEDGEDACAGAGREGRGEGGFTKDFEGRWRWVWLLGRGIGVGVGAHERGKEVFLFCL